VNHFDPCLRSLEEAEIGAGADGVRDLEVSNPVVVEIDIVAVLWRDDAVDWCVNNFRLSRRCQSEQSHSRRARSERIHVELLME